MAIEKCPICGKEMKVKVLEKNCYEWSCEGENHSYERAEINQKNYHYEYHQSESWVTEEDEIEDEEEEGKEIG